jgi:hypothetical protein
MTPGVSILRPFSFSQRVEGMGHNCYSRLALEVLHNVKEPVIHIWLLRELDLDLVKIAESILFETGISTGVPRKQTLTASFCMFGTVAVSHIEYGLLALVHSVARNWSQCMTGRHASSERRRLVGAPTAIGLERRPEHGCCTAGCAYGTIRRHGAMLCRGEHLMLR